jgi:hypothetical protein
MLLWRPLLIDFGIDFDGTMLNKPLITPIASPSIMLSCSLTPKHQRMRMKRMQILFFFFFLNISYEQQVKENLRNAMKWLHPKKPILTSRNYDKHSIGILKLSIFVFLNNN